MRFTKVHIESLGYQLPSEILYSETLEQELAPVYEQLCIPPGQIAALTGVHERRLWAPHTALSEGASQAALKAIDKAGLAPEQIEMLVFCGVCRDAMEPASGIMEYIQKARDEHYIRNIALVSNVIWGQQRCQRVINLASQLHIDNIYTAWFWDGKPSAMPFVAAMKMMNSQPENTAIVGDQVFTDIYGGNRLGLYTILVTPLGPDHLSTGLMQRRYLEEQLIRSFQLEPKRKANREVQAK